MTTGLVEKKEGRLVIKIVCPKCEYGLREYNHDHLFCDNENCNEYLKLYEIESSVWELVPHGKITKTKEEQCGVEIIVYSRDSAGRINHEI